MESGSYAVANRGCGVDPPLALLPRKVGEREKATSRLDVGKAAGWDSLESLKTAYQQAGEATMLQVVLEAGEWFIGRKIHLSSP